MARLSLMLVAERSVTELLDNQFFKSTKAAFEIVTINRTI